MIRPLVAVAFAILTCFASPAVLAASPDYTKIDAYVEAQRHLARVPGMALVVVEGDRVAHVTGFGEASPGTPVTPQTPFIIGSLTKSITALAILQLVDAKKVDLDTPVRRYLPTFRVSDPAASEAITVRELLRLVLLFQPDVGACAVIASLANGLHGALRLITAGLRLVLRHSSVA